MKKILNKLYLHQDTCNVYVIDDQEGLIIINAGNGSVIEEIYKQFPEKNIKCVLNTHHFRPVVQGLPLFEKADIEIMVPYWEQDLFAGTTAFWQERQTWINYDGNQDRFSPIVSIKPGAYLMDYDQVEIGSHLFEIIPAPGPTTGGIALLTELDGNKVVFSGDLIYSPGKVWNLASSQWNYNDAYGVSNWIQSIRRIKKKYPEILLPAHGNKMSAAMKALNELETNLMQFLTYRARQEELNAIDENRSGLEKITEHLYLDKDAGARTFYLISESGKVLALDYGYNNKSLKSFKFHFATRRALLHGLESLEKEFGIKGIDVVIPSHVHDDHVCGIPVLQRLFGTRVWTAGHMQDILENPYKYNIQCIWPEEIQVERAIPFNQEFQWEEYTFKFHPAGAHTYYSAVIEFEVDGKTVIHTGDQQGLNDEVQREDRFYHNYVYQNRYRREEMKEAAKIMREIEPDLIISGHWDNIVVNEEVLRIFEKAGKEQEEIHRKLLPVDEYDWNCDHIGAEIFPYHLELKKPDLQAEIKVKVRNPFQSYEKAKISLVLPEKWKAVPGEATTDLDPLSTSIVHFELEIPKNTCVRRQPIAADITIGNQPMGQLTEALVTVNWPEETRWGGGYWS